MKWTRQKKYRFSLKPKLIWNFHRRLNRRSHRNNLEKFHPILPGDERALQSSCFINHSSCIRKQFNNLELFRCDRKRLEININASHKKFLFCLRLENSFQLFDDHIHPKRSRSVSNEIHLAVAIDRNRNFQCIASHRPQITALRDLNC